MKLTHDNIFQFGFRGEGKSPTGKPLYRLKVPPHNGRYYAFELQLEINDYPETNPNCGIISLYMPGIKNAHMFVTGKKTEFELWNIPGSIPSNPDHERGGIKFIDIREFNQPVAWYVSTLQRLNDIYTALTQNPPLLPFNSQNHE